MIDRTDVIQVADSIGVSLTEKQIELIIANYPSYAAVSVDNWTLIVEDMIYDIDNTIENLPEDMKEAFDDSEERRDFGNDDVIPEDHPFPFHTDGDGGDDVNLNFLG
jgi:hypothetical protein